jgi:hypothetical protein
MLDSSWTMSLLALILKLINPNCSILYVFLMSFGVMQEWRRHCAPALVEKKKKRQTLVVKVCL